MDKFIDKFNIFDLFSMLIPGIGITTLLGITLSFRYYELWEDYGTSKYVIFFIFSYFLGIVFHELGSMADKILFKTIYGGKPREICFMDPKPKKQWQFYRVIFFDDEDFFKNVKKLYDYIWNKYVNTSDNNGSKNVEKSCKIENEDKKYDRNNKKLNSLVFGYCLNIAENKNIAGKYKNFNVISEMSRSLFCGSVVTIILNMIMFIVDPCNNVYYMINILILIVLGCIFIHRKARYERYQIRILLREVYLYLKETNII